MSNLIFHYQTVLHNNKNGIYLHEAFSSRSGDLYSVNPTPVEVNGDTEEEVEETLRTMETDSSRYRPVKIGKITKEMLRWKDEVQVSINPAYDDEDDLQDDYYVTDGEVLDLVDFIERNR